MPRSPEKPPRPKSPEHARAKEWHEVHRPHEVVAIGDLHGNYEAFEKNSDFVGIYERDTQGKIVWTGGTKTVVFLGDILADRYADGPRILTDICELTTQAEQAGGKVVLLAGNHDMWGLAYLLGEGADDVRHLRMTQQIVRATGIGIVAFLAYGYASLLERYNKIPRASNRTTYAALTMTDEPILTGIRAYVAKNPEIQKIYTQYRLIHKEDDTLFFHCNPTQDMVEDLLARTQRTQSLEAAIEEINTIFIENLTRCLSNPHEKVSKEFTDLAYLYTKTINRTSYTNPHALDLLRANGVNAIIHGHSVTNNQELRLPSFTIVSVDQSAFVDDAHFTARSTATVATSGVITRGIYNDVLRDLPTSPQSQNT